MQNDVRISVGAPKGNQYAKGNTKENCNAGPPFKEIDAQTIFDMASHDATIDEICAVLDIAHDTIYARKDLTEALRRGRMAGSNSVKSALFKLGVEDKHPGILIWLSKVRCGYQETKVESNEEMIKRVISQQNKEPGIGTCK